MEWNPTGKRKKEKSNSRWRDEVEKDLKKVGVKEWRRMVINKEEWREIGQEILTHAAWKQI